MTLLDIARGPALEWSIIIFLFGFVYRLVHLFMFQNKKTLAKAKGNAILAGYKTIITRSIPHKVFRKRLNLSLVTSYTWHTGFLLVLILFAPHIQFFKGLFGFSWPNASNNMITAISGLTLVIVIWLFFHRFFHPVLKKISKVGDYLALIIVALPLVTGLLASAHLLTRYENMLAIHLYSVCLLLVWFPFSKLMHAILFIPSRKRLGSIMGHKGVRS